MSEQNWRIIDMQSFDTNGSEWAWNLDLPDGFVVRVDAEMDDGRRFARIQHFTREEWAVLGKDRCEQIVRDATRPPPEE